MAKTMLVMILAAISVSVAVACDAGTSGTTSCTACAAGRYSMVANAASCTACPLGTYTAATGATVCELCASGTYAYDFGLTVCTTCTGGTFGSSCTGTRPETVCAADGVSCVASTSNTLGLGWNLATTSPLDMKNVKLGNRVFGVSSSSYQQQLPLISTTTYFTVPGGVLITPKNIQASEISTTSYSSTASMAQSMTASLGITGTPPKGSFTGNAAFKKVRESMATEERNQSYTHTQLQYASVSMDGSLPYDPTFIRRIALLPATTPYDQALYWAFIEDYGTHYVSQATIGGDITISSATASCLQKSMSQQTLDATLKLDFNIKMLNRTGGTNKTFSLTKTQEKQLATVRQNSENNLIAVGGFALEANAKSVDLDAWKLSVKTATDIIGWKIRPITGPVSAVDPAKAALMTTAITEYLVSQSAAFVDAKVGTPDASVGSCPVIFSAAHPRAAAATGLLTSAALLAAAAAALLL